MTFRPFFLFYIVLSGCSTSAQQTQAATLLDVPNTSPSQLVLCKNKNVVRTVRLEKTQEANQPKCIVTYTKEGVDQVVGSSSSSERCEEILENIQGNLAKASWTCKRVSQSMVTKTQE